MENYVHTRFGLCPDCRRTAPGHVYVHEPSGEAGWQCPYPECDAFAPTDDVELGPVAVPPKGAPGRGSGL